MAVKLIKLVILGALLLTLAPGSATALCNSTLEKSCCCGEGGKCPMPSSQKAKAQSCCQGSGPEAVPPTGESQPPTPVSSLTAVRIDAGAGVTAPARSAPRDERGGPRSPGVTRYTLHASFLI